jgi:hypothetical protein
MTTTISQICICSYPVIGYKEFDRALSICHPEDGERVEYCPDLLTFIGYLNAYMRDEGWDYKSLIVTPGFGEGLYTAVLIRSVRRTV